MPVVVCGSKITADQILRDRGMPSPQRERITPRIKQLDIEAAPRTLIFERALLTFALPALLLFVLLRLYHLLS